MESVTGISNMISSSTEINSRTSDVTAETTNATTPDGLNISLPVSIGIIVATTSLIVVGAILYLYVRKRRPYICIKCLNVLQSRRRRSSTSSQGPLTQDDATFVTPSVRRTEQELFSIADQDGGEDGRQVPRGRRGTEDDYFYDEIFERSAFVDESTYRANKQLTIEHVDEDEILGDTHVPDLIFKKPNKRL
ncbi:hypothetical protein ACF0H5_020399 [Mactra antiquata]